MAVSSIQPLNQESDLDAIQQARIDLACAFRWAARLDMHEGTANHFSLSVNDDGTRFLINPNGRHFSTIKASELILVDANDQKTMEREDAPDPTAWGLHGAVHRRCPQARCALHLHPQYATVLASLADSTMLAIDQNTARFFNRVVIDEFFGGMALAEEAERCVEMLNQKRIMIMGNHGIMATAPSVAQAFDEMYYFERAARTLVIAYMTQKPLRILPDEIAEKTAQQWDNFPGYLHHFNELKVILDEQEPDYRD